MASVVSTSTISPISSCWGAAVLPSMVKAVSLSYSISIPLTKILPKPVISPTIPVPPRPLPPVLANIPVPPIPMSLSSSLAATAIFGCAETQAARQTTHSKIIIR